MPHPDHTQFTQDMTKAGHAVSHYHGRLSWSGPAVRVETLDQVTAHTRIPVQYDNSGEGLVVYPCAYAPADLAALKSLVETAGPTILYTIASAADAGIIVPEKDLGLAPTMFTQQDIPARAAWRARNN